MLGLRIVTKTVVMSFFDCTKPVGLRHYQLENILQRKETGEETDEGKGAKDKNTSIYTSNT